MKKLYISAAALLLAGSAWAQSPTTTDDIAKTTKAVMEQAAEQAPEVSPWKRNGNVGLNV